MDIQDSLEIYKMYLYLNLLHESPGMFNYSITHFRSLWSNHALQSEEEIRLNQLRVPGDRSCIGRTSPRRRRSSELHWAPRSRWWESRHSGRFPLTPWWCLHFYIDFKSHIRDDVLNEMKPVNRVNDALSWIDGRKNISEVHNILQNVIS